MATKKQQQTVSSTAQAGTADLRRLSKPKEDFTSHVQALLEVYDAHPADLRIAGVTSEAVLEQLATYQTLRAKEAAAQRELLLAQETRAMSGAAVWDTLLDIYARAQAASRNDNDIRRGIADFQHFMKTGHRKKPTVATPAPATPTTTA